MVRDILMLDLAVISVSKPLNRGFHCSRDFCVVG